MKFSSQFLALCLLQGTTAFMAPVAKPASGALNALSYRPGTARGSEMPLVGGLNTNDQATRERDGYRSGDRSGYRASGSGYRSGYRTGDRSGYRSGGERSGYRSGSRSGSRGGYRNGDLARPGTQGGYRSGGYRNGDLARPGTQGGYRNGDRNGYRNGDMNGYRSDYRTESYNGERAIRTSDLSASRSGRRQNGRDSWDTTTPVKVQGGALRTWSFTDTEVDRVQVLMSTEGNPLNADVDLWNGPDSTPQKMRVYSEDGFHRPFSAVIDCPNYGENTIAVRNTGQLEFPLDAGVEDGTWSLMDTHDRLHHMSYPEPIQGGAEKTYRFEEDVESVQVLLTTDGRPLNARIELLQGPNNDKQTIELYTEDGFERPFFAVIETPGVGNVVRVVNTAPVEFPLDAAVDAYMVDNYRRRGGMRSGMDTRGDGVTGYSNFFDSGGRL